MTTQYEPIDGLDLPIWGAASIGRCINRDPRQTYYLLETGKIDATKVGTQWTSTPRRIFKSLGMEA